MISLTDGTEVVVTAGTPAPTDTFTVSEYAVIVTGPSYCVIPANTDEEWDSDVAGTYTASYDFDAETFSEYHWSGSGNVHVDDSSTFSDWNYADGTSSTGHGKVTCTIYDEEGNPHSGDADVTVVNQFTWNWDTTSTTVINVKGYNGLYGLYQGGSGGTSVGYTQTWTAGVTSQVALSVSASVGQDEIAEAADSLSYTQGFSYQNVTQLALSHTVAPNASDYVAIGQLQDATHGKLTIATPNSGPGIPQDVYKYAPVGNTDSLLVHTSRFATYSDPNLSGVYLK